MTTKNQRDEELPSGEADSSQPSGALPPKPLMCRLGDLLKDWRQQEKIFNSKNNDEASCVIYACSEQLREVVVEFLDDVCAWQSADSTPAPVASQARKGGETVEPVLGFPITKEVE